MKKKDLSQKSFWNQLDVIDKISKKLKIDNESIKKDIIKNIGSDWKIKDKSLLYNTYLLPRAIKKIKNSRSPDFPKFRLINDSNTAEKITSAEDNIIWRKGRDSNP